MVDGSSGTTGVLLRGTMPLAADEMVELVLRAIDRGFGPVMLTEVAGPASTVVAGAAAVQRPGALLGSAIVPLGSRSMAALAMESATVAELAGGPFLLGVGVSAPQIVEGWHQITYDASLRATEQRLKQLRALLDGEPQGSFSLAGTAGRQVQLLLGALGPRMLELAFEHAAGAIVHLTPVAALSPPPDGRSLYATVWVGACEDAAQRARREIVSYASSPPYARHLTRLGYGTVVARVESLRSGGRLRDAPEEIPEELLRSIYVDGDELPQRLALLRSVGVHPLVVPVTGRSPAEEVARLFGGDGLS